MKILVTDNKNIEKYFFGFEIYLRDGKSSCLSTVRTLLSMGKDNIILVLTLKTFDRDEALEKEAFVNMYLGYSDDVKTIWVKPEIKIVKEFDNESIKKLKEANEA